MGGQSVRGLSRGRWGVFVRRERWGLTWKVWLALILGLLLQVRCAFVTVHPFLAATHRVDSSILVVEGWVHDYVIRAAAKEFSAGDYQRVFSTGGPSAGSGGYTGDANTSAIVGAGQLRGAGIPAILVQMVPSRVIGRDRTYYSAVALRDWFREHNLNVGSFNIVAENTHARRTWLLFQRAFGD